MSQHSKAQEQSAVSAYLPTWNGFRSVGESRILRSSYVWLVIVPIAARVLEAVRSPLNFTVLGAPITVNVDLPFSWKAFFFASVAFTVASLVYVLRCPTFVREHKDFADFTSKGKKQLYIGLAAKVVDSRIKDEWVRQDFIDSYNSWVKDRDGRDIDTEQSRRETFWMVYERLDDDHFGWRVLLGFLYLIGFLLIGRVAVQNVWYVVRVTLS